jgi:hypothetical protein
MVEFPIALSHKLCCYHRNSSVNILYCIEIIFFFSFGLTICNSRITIHFLQLRYVSATIFGHHHVVTLNSLCCSPFIGQYLQFCWWLTERVESGCINITWWWSKILAETYRNCRNSIAIVELYIFWDWNWTKYSTHNMTLKYNNTKNINIFLCIF